MVIALLAFCLSACAQTKYGISRVYAFTAERQPGNIPVDENGKSLYHGPDTLNFIYIESGKQQVLWDMAWKNGRTYSVEVVRVNENPLVIGERKSDNNKMIITRAGGNTLWRVSLVPSENNIPAPQKLRYNEILLRGKFGGKTIFQKIAQPVELLLPPSV